MGDGGLDKDRIRELQAQSRGEKPIEAEPGTGFHPDQLTSYPLSRIGPKFYQTHLEAIHPSNDGRDYIFIDSNEMEDYSFHQEPDSDQFADSRVWYSVSGDIGSLKGQGTLVYKDLDTYFEELENENVGDDYSPNVVLATTPDKDVLNDERLSKVKQILEEPMAIHVLS